MQSPCNYKTEYGLYRATMRAIEAGGMKKAWFCEGALWHCREAFPALLPQLERLIADSAPRTLADLRPHV